MHTIVAKKFLSTIIGFCFFSSLSSLVLGWYLVKKFTARPIYSQRRICEHEKNRSLLLQDLLAQQINFCAHDSIMLSGYLITRPAAQRVILLCHGYRMCKERMYAIVRMFPDDSIFLFDYRAHGQSEGKYTTFGHLEQHDVLAAITFLQTHEKTKDLPILGIGVSMGAVSLLAAACQSTHLKAVVLDSPFLRLDRQARKLLAKRYKLPEFPMRLFGEKVFAALMNFSMREVNALNWAKLLQIPTLIIHSVNDDTVPIKDAVKLFDAIGVSKDFWKVDSSGHARIFNDCSDEYQQKVRDFFSRVL